MSWALGGRLNDKMDEMMYERGTLVTGGLSLPALKEQAHINSAARAAGASPEFSKLIRAGRVGFADDPSSARPIAQPSGTVEH
jgi:hypothetical protein